MSFTIEEIYQSVLNIGNNSKIVGGIPIEVIDDSSTERVMLDSKLSIELVDPIEIKNQELLDKLKQNDGLHKNLVKLLKKINKSELSHIDLWQKLIKKSYDKRFNSAKALILDHLGRKVENFYKIIKVHTKYTTRNVTIDLKQCNQRDHKSSMEINLVDFAQYNTKLNKLETELAKPHQFSRKSLLVNILSRHCLDNFELIDIITDVVSNNFQISKAIDLKQLKPSTPHL